VTPSGRWTCCAPAFTPRRGDDHTSSRVRALIHPRPAIRDGGVDLVVSNGVNLALDKSAVFHAAARVLAPGGRLALADIVSERALTESITCNAELWASCICGATSR
jgi:hypothetical protein